MGDVRNTYRVLRKKTERKNHLEDLGADGSIILKWTIQYWNQRLFILLVSFVMGKEFPIYIEYEAVFSPKTVWAWTKRIQSFPCQEPNYF
jgi:hypothetical protein